MARCAAGGRHAVAGHGEVHGGARAAEVIAWVNERLDAADRWVALDDSWPAGTDDSHVVHVDPATGLTEADAARAREILLRA